MKYLKFSFISMLFITFCLNLTAGAATNKEMLMSIDLAGKQRMLTQKMSKEILLIAKNIDRDDNKKNLCETAALFNQTLTGLIYGDSELGLVKTEKLAIKRQLYKVVKLWNKFRINVDVVLMGNTSPAVLKKIAVQNLPLLNEMNEAVNMYERESGSTLEYGMAKTLNLAGKQRMLTQKMTKELLLVAIGIEPDNNKKELAKTVRSFKRTLTGLLDGDGERGLPKTENPAIREQLKRVKKQWDSYEPILTKSKVSGDDLSKAAEFNISLLDEMKKAVQMYRDYYETNFNLMDI